MLPFPQYFILAWRLCISSLTPLRIFRVQEPLSQSHSVYSNCFGGVGTGAGEEEKGNQMESNATGKSQLLGPEVQQTQNKLFPKNNILSDCIRFKCPFVAGTWFPYESVLRSKQPVYNWILRTQTTYVVDDQCYNYLDQYKK